MADWIIQCGITTVAMESTGIYWIPVYELLEARGLEVKLVDARQTKNVSNRKTDVLDWYTGNSVYSAMSVVLKNAPPATREQSGQGQKKIGQ